VDAKIDSGTTVTGKSLLSTAAARSSAPSYWLTRFAILRLLGLVYFVAFFSLALQLKPLLGRDGLLPIALFLKHAQAHFGSRLAGFLQVPSLFWVDDSDRFLLAMAWLGVALSLLVCLGYANAILLGLLWALYASFVHVGQEWYAYGWDILLLETGFLAVFLCPLLDGRPFPRRPPPVPVLWLYRWLIFRIMLGAGLIKIRGDSCWRNFTCLYYHFETQPIPNPLSRLFHFLPHLILRLGVGFNDLAELVSPWFAFGPRRARHIAGALMFLLQVFLILSGNLSFLNYLTIVPILACFDDSLLRRLLPRVLVARAERAAARAQPSRAQSAAVCGLVAVVALLSINPVRNLLSTRQIMNGSFDRLDLVNTYGAFGTVTRERLEIIFEGTDAPVITEKTRWKPYEFKCKPGDPMRRPCVISPYHLRLDWAIWFAAMSTPDQYPWTFHFVWKLLHNDPGVLGLLAGNPFPHSPPRYIRAELYRYKFARPGDPSGAWWKRTRVGEWLPPLSAGDPRLRRFLYFFGWLPNEGAEDRR
jgi:hypothetical protein